MYLDICESPLRIKDKSTGKFIYIPCGKCKTCLNHRSTSMCNRLEQESKCHKYTFFFTLTFAEKFVPRLYLNDDYSLVDPATGLFVDPSSEIRGFKYQSKLYLGLRKNIPYVGRKVAQDFIKRFRYYYENLLLFTNENKRLRYYIVSEYGPSTYRPHFHGLFFCDSDKASSKIEEILSKAWQFGRTDISLVRGKASSYVSRYVNSVNSLPKVYLCRELRPFALYSKCPALGTLQESTQTMREIFYCGITDHAIQSAKDSSSIVVPLGRSFESKLFPRIAGFDKLSHSQRVNLYSIYSQCPCEGFESFIEFVKEIIFKYLDTSFLGLDHWLAKYLYVLLQNDLKSNPVLPSYSRLKRLYYVSSRVVHQSKIFNVSLDLYVNRIEEYYSHKCLSKLRRFYEFQESFSIEHKNAFALIHMYDFGDLFYRFSCGEESEFDRSVLQSFGYSLDYFIALNQISFGRSLRDQAYKVMVRRNRDSFDRSMKIKRFNDYLQSRADKFDFNILKHYE